MEQQINTIKNYNDYSFCWGKQFGFLTLKTLDTKLSISHSDVSIDMNPHYFGMFRGKNITKAIPIHSIVEIETKTLLSYPDLVIAVIFLLGGIYFNPLFLLIVPICIYACINSNIIIHMKSGKPVRIPSFSKKDAKEFISYIKDIYLT